MASAASAMLYINLFIHTGNQLTNYIQSHARQRPAMFALLSCALCVDGGEMFPPFPPRSVQSLNPTENMLVKCFMKRLLDVQKEALVAKTTWLGFILNIGVT